jgi:long-chain acyl-CoA synthetase
VLHRSMSDDPAITIAPSGQSLSFGELDDKSHRFARALRLLGMREGDRIAILLGNQIEYPVILLGSRAGGYDHLPLNTHAKFEEQLAILEQFAPTAVVVAESLASQAERLAEALPSSIHWIMVGTPSQKEWWSYDALVQIDPADRTKVRVAGKLLLLSGGSTGR